MSSPAPSPTPHCLYVLSPTSNKDSEVHFLINLLHLRITDILNQYKTNEPRTTHIVESAPSPYDPFTVDWDDIYEDETPLEGSSSPVLVQPQPQQASSLPLLTSLAETPDVEPIVSLPPSLVNESPFFQPSPSNSSPTTPPVHITHDTTGWNWIHASTGDAYYTSPVPYATGHFPDEDWPKIVPLDADGFRS